MEKKIFAFVGQAPSLEAYKKLNFTPISIDPILDLCSVEADLTNYGWMSVLGVLKECDKAGLKPGFRFGDKLMNFAEAVEFANIKATEEELAFDMRDINDLK
jgi:hypothetical protein